MKYSDVSIAATPEVLKRKLGAEYLKEIEIHSSAFTNERQRNGIVDVIMNPFR